MRIPVDYFSYKKSAAAIYHERGRMPPFFQAADRYPHNPANPLIEYTAAVIFRLQYSTGMRPQEARLLRGRILIFPIARYTSQTRKDIRTGV